MSIDSRNRQQELQQALAGYRADPGMDSLRQLLKLRLEELDQKLRQCPLDSVQTLQGKAQALQSLMEDIFTKTYS